MLEISKGARYMMASAFSFSVMSLLVKMAGERLPSQEVVLGRAIVSLILSYWLLRRKGIDVWGTNRKLLILRGLFGFLGLSCLFYSLTHLSIAEATVIQYLHPLFTALIAWLTLKERLEKALFFSSAVSLFGVILITQPPFIFGETATSLNPITVAIAIGGALFAALAYVVVRRLSKTEHPLVIVFYFPFIAVPLSLPTVAPVMVWPEGWELLALISIGITTQFGQIFLTNGLKHQKAGRATAISYLQIVFATMWGIIFYAEYPSVWTLAGTLLIVGGTLGLAWREKG